MRRALIICAITAGLIGCSDDGPWGGPAGTKMAIKKEQIEKYAVLELTGSNESGAAAYSSKQAPSMKSQADTYEYVFSGRGDLCAVQMRFNNINGTDSPLMKDLKNQYGMPVRDERVDWGVVWSGDKYKLSDDLVEVTSKFSGREPNVSAVVGFSYRNLEECHRKQ
jgi:hypothetical protein